MNMMTHTLVTAAGARLLHLTGDQIYLAAAFGVAIDLDHLLKLPQYLQKNKTNKVRFYHWRTSLQEPVALLWIIPLSIYLKSLVPVIFSLLHYLCDYLVPYTKYPWFPYSTVTTKGIVLPISSKWVELIISVLALCSIVFLR